MTRTDHHTFPIPQTAPNTRGVLLCLLSAAGFGTMGVLAKGAYGAGVNATTLLSVRFALAALVFWVILAVRRGPLLGLSRRIALASLAFGVLYAAEAAAYFLALSRIDAALASLLLYLYPGIVAVAAAVLGLEALTPKRLAALGLVSVGSLLVLAGAGAGSFDLLGAGLALSAAALYSGYILSTARVIGDADPVAVTALTATSAAACFVVAGAATGTLHVASMPLAGWASAVGLALLCTVVAITAFLAGLRRVGPGNAAILSTIELVITVALAVVVLGEHLGTLQLAGGALVLGGVVLMQLRGRVRLPRITPLRLYDDEPAAVRAAPPAARPAAQAAPC